MSTTAAKPSTKVCPLCKINLHWPTKCPKLQEWGPKLSYKKVKDLKLCVLCMGPHNVGACKKPWTCPTCKKRHHGTLHFDNQQATMTINVFEIIDKLLMVKHKGSLLHIVRGMVNGEIVNILLDSGSTVNVIRDDVANRLKLPGISKSLKVHTIGGTHKESEGRLVNFTLESLDQSFTTSLEAYTVSDIMTSHQKVEFTANDIPHLKGLQFSLPLPRIKSVVIDILLGEPEYSKIVTGPLHQGQAQQPTAWGSHLGNFLGGTFTHTVPDGNMMVNVL